MGTIPLFPDDTDARMDWEFPNMREILGLNERGAIEKGLHDRVMGYLKEDGLAWVPPGHFMEGEVYKGAKVGPQKVASTWATCKILRSLSEDYKRTHNEKIGRRRGRSLLHCANSPIGIAAGRTTHMARVRGPTASGLNRRCLRLCWNQW